MTTTLSKEQMKSLLIRDKGFLKQLFEGDNIAKNKRLILYSNDLQLITLLKFLHFLATGQITIKKENFEKLTPRILKLIKKNVEKQTKLYDLINSDRQLRVKFLLQLCKFYNILLECLFIE